MTDQDIARDLAICDAAIKKEMEEGSEEDVAEMVYDWMENIHPKKVRAILLELKQARDALRAIRGVMGHSHVGDEMNTPDDCLVCEAESKVRAALANMPKE